MYKDEVKTRQIIGQKNIHRRAGEKEIGWIFLLSGRSVFFNSFGVTNNGVGQNWSVISVVLEVRDAELEWKIPPLRVTGCYLRRPIE